MDRLRFSLLRSERGFTLLEVLISMMILGVLSLVIFAGMRLGVRARDTGEAMAENNQRVRAVFYMISSQIKSVRPYFYQAQGEDGVEETMIAFEGEPDSIRFISSAPRITPGKRPEGLHDCSIYLEKDFGLTKSRGLLLREATIRYPFDFEDRGEPLVLASDITDIRFQYYYAVRSEEDKEEVQTIWFDSSREALKRILRKSAAKGAEGRDDQGEEGDQEDAAEPQKSLPRLPLAVRISFTLSVGHEGEGKATSIKLKFPPTVIQINSGLEGGPEFKPGPEEEALSEG